MSRCGVVATAHLWLTEGMTETGLGGFCYTADAIVPIPEDGVCDWCDGRHFVRYRWNADTREWDTVSYASVDGPAIEKPENYSEDGI